MNLAAIPTIDDGDVDVARWIIPPTDRAKVITTTDVRQEFADEISGRKALEGLPAPLPGFEAKVRFQPGDLCVWSGCQHHGKTAFLKMLMLHAVRSGRRICMASFEETVGQTLRDMASMCAQKQQITEAEGDQFLDWGANRIWLYNRQDMVSLERVIAVMAYAAAEKDCSHFVIDSLMRLAMPRDDYEQQRKLFNLLGAHAKLRGVCVHIVCHSRKPRDDGQIPGAYDVLGASDIVNQADKIFVVWRDMREPHERKPDSADGLLGVKKQRGRPNWVGKIKLWMDEPSGQLMVDKGRAPFRFMSEGETWRDYA